MTDPVAAAQRRVADKEAELRQVREARVEAQRRAKNLTAIERALESAGRERDAAISPEVLALQGRIETAAATIREARLSVEHTDALWGNVQRRQLGARTAVGEDRAARLEKAITEARDVLQEAEHGTR